jgi:hypothetical protein
MKEINFNFNFKIYYQNIIGVIDWDIFDTDYGFDELIRIATKDYLK